MQRENHVNLLRSYRSGELPDILIKSSDIIRPLMALVRSDQVLAQHFLGNMITGILSKVGRSTPYPFAQLRGHFEALLSTISHPPFIACLFGLIFRHEELTIDCILVGQAALRSHNDHLGIRVLEKQISEKEESGKSSYATEIRKAEAQLTKLYRSLKEVDIVLTLGAKQFPEGNLTRSALEQELRGDYMAAFRTYEQALDALEKREVIGTAEVITAVSLCH